MDVLFDPHGDDAALFASFLCLKYKPLVVVTHRTVPTEEIDAAMKVLGCKWEERSLDDPKEYAVWIAPGWHSEGHEEHNLVANAVGADIRYATYAPRGQRTRTDNEVPYEPWMVARKLRALSCFESQIEQESTRPWFTYLLDVREWYA